jgi:hypothetical protein
MDTMNVNVKTQRRSALDCAGSGREQSPGNGSWLLVLLHLVCCGGAVVVLLGGAALPALWAWLTAEARWLLPAAVLLLAGASLLWGGLPRRRARAPPPAGADAE